MRTLEMAEAGPGGSGGPAPLILAVDDDDLVLDLIRTTLERDGYRLITAASGQEALRRLEDSTPVLIVSDVNMPGMDGFELLEKVRADPATSWMPFLLLTTRRRTHDVVAGLTLGADDYLPKPFAPSELSARVRAKVERPPVPFDQLPVDRETGLLSRGRLEEELRIESLRAVKSGSPGLVVVVGLSEMRGLELRLGRSVAQATMRQVASVLEAVLHPLDRAGRLDETRLAIVMPDTDAATGVRRIEQALAEIAARPIVMDEERLRITPSAGYATFSDAPGDGPLLLDRAGTALEYATTHLDLMPLHWEPAMDEVVARERAEAEERRVGRVRRGILRRLRTPFQIALTLVLGLVLPFFGYLTLDRAGHDITPVAYLVVVVSLATTGALIWLEGLLSLRREDPPEEPGEPYPPASAIIAAYLPNEAATIIETIEAFLRVDYPAPLQVILAYNTPSPMPVEAALRRMESTHPRLTVLRVENSTSKAQNVNAALSLAEGRFVGVFDADHLPEPEIFRRAWRWLSRGYDVVQGHCLVRNGRAGFVARMTAVEFEAIYAVSHPGRARMHDFGIFGGSNGFWRTDLLHEVRMRGSMLTEDIDSSMRILEAGGRVRSDPGLVSRELGTTTLRQIWNQRMRWAQGWFQVSLRHMWRAVRSHNMTLRQKLGVIHLLGWREVYPWVSVQAIPIVGYWIYRGDALDWLVPIFVLTTVFTLSVGPWQTYFAWRQADPEIRRHGRWFLAYLVWSSVFYTEYKNFIARVAQMKELTGERDWRVTPRSADPVDEEVAPVARPRKVVL